MCECGGKGGGDGRPPDSVCLCNKAPCSVLRRGGGGICSMGIERLGSQAQVGVY